MNNNNVLVACPTHSFKEYAIEQWITAVKALTHPHSVLMVDNSHGMEFYNKWSKRIPMLRMDPGEFGRMHGNTRIAKSMGVIRNYVLNNGYRWYLSIEADVIAPPNTIEMLLSCSEGNDMVCAPYPVRGRQQDVNQNSFGCTLFSRRLLEYVDFGSFRDAPTADRIIHNDYIIPSQGAYKVFNLPLGILDVKHLEEPAGPTNGFGWY